MVTSVTPALVLEDIQRLQTKGVDVRGKEVTVEFQYGDNDVALADYRFVDGVYYLSKVYDPGVHWPEEVREAGASSSGRPPDDGSGRRRETLNQYERLRQQIENAQYSVEQAKLTDQPEVVEDQQRRLDIGRRNLKRLLREHPELATLPRPVEFPSINLATAEGRERGRQLVMESNIPTVEKGKRVVLMHTADAAVEIRHPGLRALPTARPIVRPPMRTAFEDLRLAQRDLQRMNNQGLFAQFGNSEARHNNLLRLQSTRRTLELLLKRFPTLPGVAAQDQKDVLGLIYSVIQASKKLEQGSQANFLSRFWNQQALRDESTKIIRGLKHIDQFIATHPGFF